MYVCMYVTSLTVLHFPMETTSLLCKRANDAVFNDFQKISDHPIFQSCSKGQTNISEHFTEIAEDDRRRFEDVLIVHQQILV